MCQLHKRTNDIQDKAIAVAKSILAESDYDVKHLAAKPIAGGISNHNFQISYKQTVLWVAKLSKGFISHGLQKEAHAYRLLRNTSQDLDCRFKKKSAVNSSDALLVQYASGQVLNQWRQVPLITLSKVLKSVHGVVAGTAGNLLKPKDVKVNPTLTLEKSWRYFSRYNAQKDNHLASIKARIASILLQHQSYFDVISAFSLIHGDIHPNNLILDSANELQLIDWERAHYGDPAFDLVAINWHDSNTIIAQEVQQQLIKSYSHDPATQAELQLRANCWALFRLFTDYLFISQHELLPNKREQFFTEITDYIKHFSL